MYCLICKKLYPRPLKDFAAGRVTCGNEEKPHTFTIPNNGRYYRLIREIDEGQHDVPEGLFGLVQVRTEPYLVRYNPMISAVEAYHVSTNETRKVADGHYAGKGQMLGWNEMVDGDLGASVLVWLNDTANQKLTN